MGPASSMLAIPTKALGVPKIPVYLSSISADASNILHAHVTQVQTLPCSIPRLSSAPCLVGGGIFPMKWAGVKQERTHRVWSNQKEPGDVRTTMQLYVDPGQESKALSARR